MPSTFKFCCLELNRRSCETSFPKIIVYSDVVCKGQTRRKILSLYFRTKIPKVADLNSYWQVLKFSRLTNYSKLCKLETERCLSKNVKKNKNHSLSWNDFS